MILTERLELVPLVPSVLELIERGDAHGAAHELDAVVPERWTETIPARRRLEQLAAIRASNHGSCGRPSCERGDT